MVTWLSAFVHTGGLTTFWAWLALTGLGLGLLRLKQFGQLTPVAVALLGFSALVVLNPLLPSNRIPAISWEIAAKLLCLPAGYWLARQSPTHAPLHRHVHWTLLIVAAVAVFEFAITRTPPYATLADPNALAAAWNAGAFAGLGLLLSRLSAPRPAGVTMLWPAIFLLCLGLSLSLSGQLSFLLGLALFYGFGVYGKLPHIHRAAASALLAFGLSAAFAAVISDSAKNNLDRALAPAGDGSIQHRLALLDSSWQIYLSEPLTGTGLGSFKLLYPQYRSPAETSSSGDLVHNDYAQLLMEGGPLLPLALIAVGLAALLRLRRAMNHPALVPATRWLVLGHATAAACIFFHAAFNFIIYVMPLALLMGYHLGRLDALTEPKVVADAVPRSTTRKLVKPGVAALLVLIGLTLGLRALFLAIAGPSACDRRICNNLATLPQFPGKLAVFLASTQPSWLLSGDYLVERLEEKARTADGAEATAARAAQLQELVGMIRAVPDVGYPYFKLGRLLASQPDLAASLPEGLPRNATAAYGMALARRPQDYDVRVALAESLRQQGEEARALTVLDDEGMPWWNMPDVSPAHRSQVLALLVQLYTGQGRCREAEEAASALKGYSGDATHLNVSLPATPCVERGS
jgi:O-antigen ligase